MTGQDPRLLRHKLPPEAFAIAPDSEPPPTDLIDGKTWGEITYLPDDVSLRTSEHHGGQLRAALEIWGHWVCLVLDIQSLVPDPRNDGLALGCLQATDEFQASIYLALTGFYRQSIAVLRSALEGVLSGAYFRAFPNEEKLNQWADGFREGTLWVGTVRSELAGQIPYGQFEEQGVAFLSGRTAWLAFLYERLSAFSHARPFYTDEDGQKIPTSNVGLWGGSNGPVYVSESFNLWFRFFLDCVLCCILLAGLSEPKIREVPKPADVPFAVFLERVIELHWEPHPVVRKIVAYLVEDSDPAS